jgi:hypothetical protein
VVELDGYETVSQVSQLLRVEEGMPPQSVAITLKPSSTPLSLQRVLR